ncbi:hypothetical protein ACFL6U_00850 [Planctomycetota bacterium]
MRKTMCRPARAWIWILIAVLILLPILSIIIYRITGDRTLQKRLDALRAQGHPVSLEELAETYALPPGTENAADHYLAAIDNMIKWEDQTLLKDLPIVGTAVWPERTEPLPPEMKKVIEQYLFDNQDALALLHETAGIPHCRYPKDLTQGFQCQLPWLSDIRQATRMLAVETMNHINNGDPNQAMQSMLSSLALNQSIHPTLLIEMLVRIALVANNIATIEHVLNRTPLTDRQLQDLTDELYAEDIKAGFHTAMQGERCMQIALFLGTTHVEGELFSLSGRDRGPSVRLLGPLRTLGYLQRDAVGYLDFVDAFLNILNRPTPNILKIEEQLNAKHYGGMFTKLITASLERVLQLGIRAETGQKIALTALAVERYRLASGHLPETLAQLIPDYLDAVITDPYDGQALRYRRLDPGYVVYSVGEDLTDSGGKKRSKENKSSYDLTFTVERE